MVTLKNQNTNPSEELNAATEPTELEELDNVEELDDSEETDNEVPVYSPAELQGFAEDVESLLSQCELGQPYDEGEVVWLNPHTTLEDVMESAGVPEECHEEVAEIVRCPYCHAHHELYEEVGTKFEGELRFESLMDKWYEAHAPKLEEFHNFLEKYPYLGAAHDFGKEIRDGVASFPSTTLKDVIFYRARRIMDGRDYTVDDFLPPDPKKHTIGEGRYNHAGQSVLYLSDDKDGAAIECLNDGESRAWVQGFRIREIEKILDLSEEEDWADEETTMLACGLTHSGAVRLPVDRKISWKPEYFVPRFIADCAKEKGFNGILFKSVRHWRSNLVLFQYNAEKVKPEGDPEIVRVETWKRADWMYKPPEDIGETVSQPQTSADASEKPIEP
jgi:hypothetical protein